MTKKQFTPITQDQIANSIKRIMKSKGIEGNDLTNHLIEKGFHKTIIYSILKIGVNAKRDYRNSSLIKILNELQISFTEL